MDVFKPTKEQTKGVFEAQRLNVPAVPVVGQESKYGGYDKLRKPFTETDEYNFVDAFFGGLKLNDFFEYSDDCLNAFIFLVDDAYYLDNNITLVNKNKTEDMWHVYLNVTHMIGGKGSEIPPQCYRLGDSVYKREDARWQRFSQDWGNFFLALLFNLMGNALNFQQRFANVKENEENQDYVGVYREYGYLVHLTYDFEPLPEAALRDINGYAKKFVTHHAGHLSEFQQNAFVEGVS